MHVDFNVFLEIVAVEIEHQVVNKVKAITHDDQRKLICKLGLLQQGKLESNALNVSCGGKLPARRIITAILFYLEEVFHSLWVVAVALSADSLHFLDLTSFAGSLDVLKVNIRLLTEIHNRSKEVKQTFDQDIRGGQQKKVSPISHE